VIASTRATSASGEDTVAASRERLPWGRLIPAGLLLAWLVVLIAHVRVPLPSDQLNYMLAAEHFPDPVPDAILTHQMTRFGLIIPASLAIDVLGYSQAAYAAVPILATLALVLGTYALGAMLFSRAVGVAAGLVVVAATPMFAESTDLLPDVLAVGLFTCALALAVAIGRRDGPPRLWVLLALGVLLGWSYMAREFIVFLWPLIPIVLYRRAGLRGIAWVAAPIVALVAVELLLCWRLYGDPLARVLAVTGHGSAPSPPEIAATYRDKPRLDYVMRLPSTLEDYRDGILLNGLLALTFAGLLAWRRRLALFAGACVLMWVPLTLLGGVIDPSAPKLRLQLIRYWFPIFPMFVLGGLAALWLLAVALRGRLPERLPFRVALPAAVVLAAATVFTGVAARYWWANEQTRLGGATQLEAFRSWMRDNDRAYRQVWADSRTRNLVRVYRSGPFGGTAWNTRLRVLVPASPDRPGPGDLVLFFDTDRGKVCPACWRNARRIWGDVSGNRPGWRLVYATPDRLVRVYAIG
jgi:4-amino-4-deoxy-L-arabinose transferase-like glycosyltransferase